MWPLCDMDADPPRSRVRFVIDWMGNHVLELAAVLIAAASFWRASRADRRSGHAIVKAVKYTPSAREAGEGKTRLTITNKGPAVAELLKVRIVDNKSTREALDRKPNHVTKIRRRLVPDEQMELTVDGQTDDLEDIAVVWRDSAGRHEVSPILHRPPRAHSLW